MNFYIVATPIGNLDDMSFRAIETLKNVDLILCEDTRQTQKLLNHYEIKTSTLSYHQHSKIQKINQILELISQGKTLALVSDAGTPGIADPGQMLVKEILNNLDNVVIVPIPGASAIISVLSVSGFDTNSFQFLGFAPKKGQAKFFKQIEESKMTSVFYESTHRIVKMLESLGEIMPERKVVLAREVTKKFETFYRGTCREVGEKLKLTSNKGEFTIIIEGK
ncbi:MAG: 16S rRNA (cytidine(1402)-2'-O)-methyltransferase [Patescibacteria group bacterium]